MDNENIYNSSEKKILESENIKEYNTFGGGFKLPETYFENHYTAIKQK